MAELTFVDFTGFISTTASPNEFYFLHERSEDVVELASSIVSASSKFTQPAAPIFLSAPRNARSGQGNYPHLDVKYDTTNFGDVARKATGLLIYHFHADTDKWTYATGFVVSKRVIATAMDCMRNPNEQSDFALEIYFVLADDISAVFREPKSFKWYLVKPAMKPTSHNSLPENFMFLQLDGGLAFPDTVPHIVFDPTEEPGSNISVVGLCSLPTTSYPQLTPGPASDVDKHYSTAEVNILLAKAHKLEVLRARHFAGYHAKVRCEGTLFPPDPGTLLHNASTSPGMSGSPVIRPKFVSEEGVVAVGIHSGYNELFALNQGCGMHMNRLFMEAYYDVVREEDLHHSLLDDFKFGKRLHLILADAAQAKQDSMKPLLIPLRNEDGSDVSLTQKTEQAKRLSSGLFDDSSASKKNKTTAAGAETTS